MRRDSKDTCRRLLEDCWNNDDHGALRPLVCDGWEFDDLDVECRGSASLSLLDLVNAYKAFAPNLQFRVVDQVRERHTVVTYWFAQGTHSGMALRVAPTGRPIRLHGAFLVTMSAAGRPVRMRGIWDVPGFLRQVGISRSEFEHALAPAEETVRMRTVYENTGPPLLLFPTMSLPGWVTWKRCVDVFAADRPVITYELMATRWAFEHGEMSPGYTLKRENRALRAALELAGCEGPYDVVGHSAGGTLALDFALDCPEHVRSLTLVEPGLSWLLAASGLLSLELQRFIKRRHSSYRGKLTPGNYARFLRAAFGEDDYDPTKSPRWPMMCAYLANMRFRQSLFTHTDDPARLAALRCPVLLIQGTNSDPLHRAGIQAFRAVVPGASFVEMPGGHVPHHGARVGAFIERLNRFLCSLDRGGFEPNATTEPGGIEAHL